MRNVIYTNRKEDPLKNAYVMIVALVFGVVGCNASDEAKIARLERDITACRARVEQLTPAVAKPAEKVREPCDLAYIRKHHPEAEQTLKEKNTAAAAEYNKSIAQFKAFVEEATSLPAPRVLLPRTATMSVNIRNNVRVIRPLTSGKDCKWGFESADVTPASVIPVGNSWREIAVMVGHK
ncbi:MAG: hypothetical protein AAB912_01000, partial [Patescibacteria group bacterium]